MMKETKKQQAKIGKVMHEYKAGTLNTGTKTGPVVKSRKQAVAIAMSQAGVAKKKK
jgi:ribosomal protein L21E